jgi:hypothetical protein
MTAKAVRYIQDTAKLTLDQPAARCTVHQFIVTSCQNKKPYRGTIVFAQLSKDVVEY